MFAYHYRININDDNWVYYSDGWSIYSDITQDAKRMGINLSNSQLFRVCNNEQFQICATYPKKIIVPKAMRDE